MIEIYRCRYCDIMIEGVPLKGCPKCGEKDSLENVATYPEINETINKRPAATDEV